MSYAFPTLVKSNKPIRGNSQSRRSKVSHLEAELQKEKSLLVIEDDQSLVEMIKMIAETNDWDLKIATTAGEAMDFLSRQPFDVILMDWNLPEFSADVLVKMADLHLFHHTDEYGYNIFNKTPVVTFSASQNPEMQLESSDYFFQLDHWAKPLSFQTLSERIEKLVKGPVGSQPVETRHLLKASA